MADSYGITCHWREIATTVRRNTACAASLYCERCGRRMHGKRGSGGGIRRYLCSHAPLLAKAATSRSPSRPPHDGGELRI